MKSVSTKSIFCCISKSGLCNLTFIPTEVVVVAMVINADTSEMIFIHSFIFHTCLSAFGIQDSKLCCGVFSHKLLLLVQLMGNLNASFSSLLHHNHNFNSCQTRFPPRFSLGWSLTDGGSTFRQQLTGKRDMNRRKP